MPAINPVETALELLEKAAARRYGGEPVSQLQRALHLLRLAFGGAALEPIRLHVDAKRYLCGVDADYHDTLTAASRASLALQGGPSARVGRSCQDAGCGDAAAQALRRCDATLRVTVAGTLIDVTTE